MMKSLLVAATTVFLALAKTQNSGPKYPVDPSTVKTCYWYYDNGPSSTLPCNKVPDQASCSKEDFLRWNPSLGSDCSNFKKNQSYCVDGPPPVADPSTSSTAMTTMVTTTKASTTTASSSLPPTPTKPSNGVSTPEPIQDGMVDNCNKFYFVQSGDSCDAVAKKNGISVDDFTKWNPGVGGTRCSTLWANVYACVNIIGREPSATKPSNGISTPSPVQPNIVDTCNKFHYVEDDQSCDDVARLNGISVKDLASWNPKIGSRCSGLWSKTYACVSVISNYYFQQGNMAGFNVADGKFSVQNNMLVAGKVFSGKAYVEAPMNDFIMDATLTVVEGGNAGLIFRASDIHDGADSYRGYYAGIGDGFMVLGRVDNGWTQLANVPVDAHIGQKYSIIVEAMGDNIDVYLDSRGHKMISVHDGTFRSGSCGVRVYNGAAKFQSVRIMPAVYEPFDVNMAGWSIADGGFDARTGVMEASSLDSGKATLNTVFGDFTMDVDVAIHDSHNGNVGVIFRANNVRDGPDSYSGYYVGIESGRVTMGRVDNSWTELKHADVQLSTDDFHHIRIMAAGGAFFVYVDDMQSIKMIVADDKFKSGFVGARVFRSGARYDNFKIVNGLSV